LRISSYLLKLIILTLLVGTFPVLILGWYSYHYSSQSVLNRAEEGSAQILRLNQLRVEENLRKIDASVSQLLSLPIISRAVPVTLGPPDIDLVQELYKNLGAVQSFELGIQDIYLYSLEKDWIISNSGINEYSRPEWKEMLKPYAAMKTGSQWISGNTVQLQGEGGTVSLQSPLLIKKWPINSLNPRGLVCVIMSPQQINGLIGDESGLGDSFIIDAGNKVIAHGDSAMLGQDLSAERYIAEIGRSPEMSGVLEAESAAGKLSVSYRKSSYNGWIYLSAVPIRAITEEARKIGWTSIIVSVGVLLLTMLLAYAGSRKMYSPVRTIYRALGNDPAARSRDEFGDISNRIQALRSDHSELKYQMEGQQKQMVELLVRKLMLGEAKASEIQARLGQYSYTARWETKRVLLFEIDRLVGSRFTERDRDLLLFAISNIASEIVPTEQRLPPVIMQDAVLLLVGAGEVSADAFKDWIFGLASSIQFEVKRYLDVYISVGISRPFFDWREAHRGYAEGGNALKYRTRLGEEAILFIEDVQPEKGSDLYYPKEVGEELIQAMKALDADQAAEALSAFMQALSKEAYDHNDYQLSLIRLFIDLIRLLQDAGISLHLLTDGEQSLFEQLLQFHSARDIEEWFSERIVLPGIRLLEERREQQFRTISDEVKRLIGEAFDTDLTLEKIASSINYHPQYISRVFRQETGVNFTDYLAQYRLEKAKQWLRETDMTVTEIAIQLKYNNPANFIRYFRKLEGMTPGQYRERHEA
jgi:two-component system response regulator YesN